MVYIALETSRSECRSLGRPSICSNHCGGVRQRDQLGRDCLGVGRKNLSIKAVTCGKGRARYVQGALFEDLPSTKATEAFGLHVAFSSTAGI